MAKRQNIPQSTAAVVYVRVSTATQADEGVSLAAQESACRQWATAQGLEVVAVCVDAGVSGGADIADCPGLMAALSELQAHPGATLIAHKRDRLARDIVRAATLERLVQSARGKLATVEGVSGDGPEAALMRAITDAFAQYERALIAARTRTALAHKKSKGERVGCLPRGYAVSADGKTLVADAGEQRVIELVRELRGQGLTLRGIAESLAAKGLTTRRGRPYSFVAVGEILRAA